MLGQCTSEGTRFVRNSCALRVCEIHVLTGWAEGASLSASCFGSENKVMKCPSCHHENPSGLKFCGECGARLILACPSCGATNPPEQKFCGECGAKLSPDTATARPASPDSYTPKHLAEKILSSKNALEGERKQVTVLFCDIANSTALAGQVGAEAMHSILNQFFEIALEQVHRYEGTVNQFLGDGFMALFGAPVAHEDHARRAVLAALGIRQTLSERQADLGLPGNAMLNVRMGAHTGPVVVGSIGDNLRMDYTAVGDTSHLAARLEQHAETGQILISESTARLVRGYVLVEEIAALTVKGKSEPVNAFQVLALGSRRSRLDENRVLSPFVGRDREFATLRQAFEEAEAGHGQVVGVVGEPGVGKSRLLQEFRQLIDARNATYLEGWCLSFGQATPYLPLQDVLRTSCRIEVTDSAAKVGEKVQAMLSGYGLSAVDGSPYLLQLLGVKEGSEGIARISPETAKVRTLDLLLQMALAQSRLGTLVLAIEDLHWIDKVSEAFLVLLVENLPGLPIMLVTTTRPGYSPTWLGKSYATQLSLRVLSDEASRRIVEATVERSDLKASATESILRKAEGNPFFLEELTLAVRERRDLDTAQALPDTVQGVLAARIDRLPEAAKRILQTASILGREFPQRVLVAITNDETDLFARLATLKHLEFLYERNDSEGPVFVFKHALTQEVAYDTLLGARRQAMHAAAGNALEWLYADRLMEHYEELAHHYSRSNSAEKALHYLVLANKKAMNASAPVEALGYFEQAMALLDTLADSEANRRRRVALLADQIVVFQNLFKMDKYHELLTRYEPVANELGDPALLGPLTLQVGHCDWTFGRFEQARQRFLKAAELCESTGNYPSAAHAYQISMWNYQCMGDFEKVIGLMDRAERAWEKGRNLRWYVYALCATALAYGYLGRFSEGIAKGHKALEVTEQFQDSAQMSFAAWSLGFAYLCKGDLTRAIEYGTIGVEKAPTPAERAWAQGSLAAAWCRAGEAGKAIAVLAPLYASLRSGRFVPGERFLLFLGEAYWRSGQYDLARQVMDEGLEIQTRHGMKYEAAVTHRLLAELAVSMNPAQNAEPLAEPHFTQSIAMLEAIHAQNDLALAFTGFGRLHKLLGRRDKARACFTRALEIFERLGALSEPDRLRAELSVLPGA